MSPVSNRMRRLTLVLLLFFTVASSQKAGDTGVPLALPAICASAYQQCGGKGWAGVSCCEAGCRCTSFGKCVPPNGLATCSDIAEDAAEIASATAFSTVQTHRHVESGRQASHSTSGGLSGWMYLVFAVQSALMLGVGIWICILDKRKHSVGSLAATAGQAALPQSPSPAQRSLPARGWEMPSMAELTKVASIAASSAIDISTGWTAAAAPGLEPSSPSTSRTPSGKPLPQSPSCAPNIAPTAFADRVFAGNRFLPYYSPSGVRRFILNFRSTRGITAPSSPSKPDEV